MRGRGLLVCRAVQTLKTDFSMRIANGRAEYEREVLRPTGTVRLGVTERGTGTVSTSGEVSLTGSAAGQTWSYEAVYRGRVDGRSLRLSDHAPSRREESRWDRSTDAQC